VGHDDGQSSAELEVGACIPSASSRQHEVVHQSGRWFLITANNFVFEERLLLNVLLTCRFACANAASRVSAGNQPVAVLGIIGQEIKLLAFCLFLCPHRLGFVCIALLLARPRWANGVPFIRLILLCKPL
jgi:hypothetical protein